MATTKASTTSKAKKAPSKKAVSAKTTTKVTSVSAKAKSGKLKLPMLNNKEVSYIVLAELVGTFVLTSVTTLTLQTTDLGALFVSLTFVALTLAIGAVSGAHVNPAVTFGLWSVGKVKSALVPIYWAAQLLGAALAIVVANTLAGTTINVDFGKFATVNWSIVGIEFVAATVFLFGFVSILGRKDLHDSAKALGVGLSLFVALAVGTNLYNNVRTEAVNTYRTAAQAAQGKAPDVPRVVMVPGVSVNPATATAVTEITEADLGTGDSTTKFSRFGLEVILGTLLGAALGANLARVFQKR